MDQFFQLLDLVLLYKLKIGTFIVCYFITLYFTGSFERKSRLCPDTYRPVKLILKEIVSDNDVRPVVFLTFDMDVSNMPTGSHISLKYHDEKTGKDVVRAYTPTRFSNEDCEFIIRVYPDGKMTQKLYNMSIGDTILMRGPTGSNRYGIGGPGVFSKVMGKKAPKHAKAVKNIVMLAGGTGITPMVQICNDIIAHDNDKTRGFLLVANSTPNDVMMHDALMDIETRSNSQIVFHSTVSRADGDEDHDHYIGRISHDLFDHLEMPGPENSVVCICGPGPFEKACKQLMSERGYSVKTQLIRW